MCKGTEIQVSFTCERERQGLRQSRARRSLPFPFRFRIRFCRFLHDHLRQKSSRLFSLSFDGKIRDVSILRNWYRMMQIELRRSYLYWSVGSARGFPVRFRSALAYASLLPLFHIWLHYIVCISCHAALPFVAQYITNFKLDKILLFDSY